MSETRLPPIFAKTSRVIPFDGWAEILETRKTKAATRRNRRVVGFRDIVIPPTVTFP
jgi:hypothetical protein